MFYISNTMSHLWWTSKRCRFYVYHLFSKIVNPRKVLVHVRCMGPKVCINTCVGHFNKKNAKTACSSCAMLMNNINACWMHYIANSVKPFHKVWHFDSNDWLRRCCLNTMFCFMCSKWPLLWAVIMINIIAICNIDTWHVWTEAFH